MIKSYKKIIYYFIVMILVLISNCHLIHAQGYQLVQTKLFYKQMKNNNIKKVECYVYYSPTDTDKYLASVMRYKKDKDFLEFVSYWYRDSSILYFNSNDLLTEKNTYSGNQKVNYKFKYDTNNKILSEIALEKGEKRSFRKYNYIPKYNIQISITYDADNVPFIVDTVWYDKEGRIRSDVIYGRENKFESRSKYFYNQNNQLIKIEKNDLDINFQYDSKNLLVSEIWTQKKNKLYYKFVYRYIFNKA
jgi:hypothetical protein